MERLLGHGLAALDQLALAGQLGVDAALDEAERVHVLQLGLRAQLLGALRADGDVRVAAKAPLLHVHIRCADRLDRRAQELQPLPRLRAGADIRLADDFDERRAAAVEVDERGAGARAVDPARLRLVHQLGSVLFQVDAVDADIAQSPVCGQRDVVLGDLVRLRIVGIEVVLAVEDGTGSDLAAQGESDLDAVLDRLRVDDRKASRVGQADRAGVDVGVVAERELAAAEHLRPRSQLDVDLEADDRFVAVEAHPNPRLSM